MTNLDNEKFLRKYIQWQIEYIEYVEERTLTVPEILEIERQARILDDYLEGNLEFYCALAGDHEKHFWKTHAIQKEDPDHIVVRQEKY